MVSKIDRRAIEVLDEKHRHRCKRCGMTLNSIEIIYVKYSHDVAEWDETKKTYVTQDRDILDSDWHYDHIECPNCGETLPDNLATGE